MWYLFVLAAVALIVIKFIKLQFFWTSRGIPYEPYHRYLYGLFWLTNRRVISDLLRENVKRYGPVYGSYQMLVPCLKVADVEIAKEVLIKQFTNFYGRQFEFKTGVPLWDNTLVRLPYDQWKAIRTVMGYTFTTSKMKHMIFKLDKIAQRLVGRLEKQAKTDDEIFLKHHMKGYGMDTMTAIAFGMDLNCIDNPDHPFIKYSTGLLKPSLRLFLFIAFPTLMKYNPFLDFPPRDTTEYFGKMAKHVIAEKKAKLDEVIKNDTADILDHHLIAQRQDPNSILTDEVLASQALLFVLAGLDTTAMTLDLTIFYLTAYPEVQEKAYQEIRQVMGDRTEVGYENVHKMKYLEGCILESLRICSAAGLLDRICTKDTEVAGQRFEKGMRIEFILSDMHKNPKYFPEPEKFLPERFGKGEVAAQQEHSAYLFFGDGPKNCVGKRLALMNMQTFLVHLLLKFKLERCSRTPPLPLEFKKGWHFEDFSVVPLMSKYTLRS